MDLVRCKCGARLALTPSVAGRVVQCSECGQMVKMPEKKTSGASAPQPPTQSPRAKNPRPQNPNAPRTARPARNQPSGVPPQKQPPANPQEQVPQPVPEEFPVGAGQYPAHQQYRKKSSPTKLLLTIGIPAFLVVMLCCGGPAATIYFVTKNIASSPNPLARKFVNDGYKSRIGQIITERDPVIRKTVFTCQVLNLNDSESDVAIFAQTATINGRIKGDVDFVGQSLTITDRAQVDGDIRIEGGQIITVSGLVHGKITGTYSILRDANRKQASGGTEDFRQTRRMIDAAKSKIVDEIKKQSIVISESDGGRIASSYRDQWNTPIRYIKDSSTRFVVRSAGPDRRWFSSDDIYEDGLLSQVIPRTSSGSNSNSSNSTDSSSTASSARPTTDYSSVRNLDEAISLIDSPGRIKREKGLDWVNAKSPTASDSQRKLLVEATLKALSDSSLKNKAAAVLNDFMKKDDLATLMDAGKKIPRGAAEILIELLTKDNDFESIIKFTNHPDVKVRARARDAVQNSIASSDLLVSQAIKDVVVPDKMDFALEILEGEPNLNEPLKTMAMNALSRIALGQVRSSSSSSSSRFSRSSNSDDKRAFRLMQSWGLSYEQAPMLVRLMNKPKEGYSRDETIQEQAAGILTKMRDPRALTFLCSKIDRYYSSSDFDPTKYILAYGPVAESYVMVALNSSDDDMQRGAIEILKKIGTRLCLSRLRSLSAERFSIVDSYAKRAIPIIQAANRPTVRFPVDAFLVTLTRRTMDNAEKYIQSVKEKQGSYPNQADGTEAVEIFLDSWGTGLKYSTEGSSFQISSAGRDRKFDSSDDLVETYPNSKPPAIGEAIEYLKSGDRSQQRVAFDYISGLDKIGSSPDTRKIVIQTLIIFLNDIDMKEPALNVLRSIVTESDSDVIDGVVDDYKKYPLRLDDFDTTLASLIASTGDVTAIASMINHPDSATRAKARETIATKNLGDSTIVQQCIKDLNRGPLDRAKLAFEMLEGYSIDDANKKPLMEALKPYYEKTEDAIYRSAAKMLAKIKFEYNDLPYLMKALDYSIVQSEVIDAIATIRDKRVLEAFEKHLLRTNSFTEINVCSKVFIAFGPCAESYTWVAIKKHQKTNLRYLLGALELIGTNRSLIHLRAISTNDSRTQIDIEKTIQEIQNANRPSEEI